MQSRKCFVDTNVLMQHSTEVFNKYEKVYICGYVLQELDKHKISDSESKKYQARQAGRDIENNELKVEYVIKEGSFSLPTYFVNDSMDNRIISVLKDLYTVDKEIVALSNDLLFRQKCRLLDIPCEKLDGNDKDDIYTGYKEAIMDEYEMSVHYECPINRFGLLNNEYLIIKDGNGEIVDKQRWVEGKGFTPINAKAFKSIYFGDIKAKDTYQQLAMDSLYNSQFTMLTGFAGTAKTLLSLGWIMQNIQSGKIGKCVIIFNPVKLKNNEQLGYYSGNRTEKLLQNSIGGILSSKLGDMTMVETLINQGKIMIIPTSDIRGIEISDNDCLFMSEAQNTDSYTMKTIIQRAKEGCKIIIEGDMEEQKDIRCSSKDNGMQRIIDVFKGSPYFSTIRLQKIYRSPIAELAQKI